MRGGIFKLRIILATYALGVLLGSTEILLSAARADYTLNMTGLTPAYQVGRHNSRNRFCYDGSCIIRGSGKIDIHLNPEKNQGKIVATFSGGDGSWRIEANKFKMIRTDVNLHGATGGDVDPKMSPPVLPKVWTYAATWGPAKVYHNGKLAWMGPAHLMVTEEVRNPRTGKVDFKGPKMAKNYPGKVYNPHGIQVHFVAHPNEKPSKGYLPPYTKFVHLMYETVQWQ
ncbi:MAG: hypothetical protein D6808_01315 [Candidatus Dadabacteria bacterium]|nr:MAG: hypothetical protein D6808_01315 [Candidatus Dadabacteria bacterium]